MIALYLIRHGQSTNNVSMLLDPLDREADPPLTDLGRQQADRLALTLRDSFSAERLSDAVYQQRAQPVAPGYGITMLYCSPMLRALQTTAPTAAALGLTPHVWIDIHEHGGMYLEHGDERGIVGYGGKTRAEIAAEFPGYFIPETITDAGWWTGGREETHAMYARAISVSERFRAEARQGKHETMAIISHGTFLDALLKAFLHQLPGTGHWFYHFNTAITRLDLREDGELNIRCLNRVDHLSADLIS